MIFAVKDLRAMGFIAPEQALKHVETLPEGHVWLSVAAATDDPDLAILQLRRLHEAAPELIQTLGSPHERPAQRLIAVLGGSRWWGDYLIANPQRAHDVWTQPPSAREVLLTAVGANTNAHVPIAKQGKTSDDMRVAYRKVLLDIVADDLTSNDPVQHMPIVGQRMATLADAALEASLALARRDIDPDGRIPFAIIAMGKTGAQELNYISDVDVLYLVGSEKNTTNENKALNSSKTSQPVNYDATVQPDHDKHDVIEIATRLAAMTAQGCSGAGNEPPLWTVDPNLRPEGRQGALVRTLDSYRQYWDKWAQSWEFQALMKARPCAGDYELGERFINLAASYVWNVASREKFVDDVRAMRTRVEENILRHMAGRELKLGPGGLRDVEFTVQLLQLVHGRTDETLRVRETHEAITALAHGGYISRLDATELKRCYSYLRVIEHRAQLTRMRRTHTVPSREDELRALSRSLGLPHTQEFTRELERVRARVRSLHENIFYRPIVAAIARLSPDEAALDRDAAKDRLSAIGYRDTEGALAHISALTRGTSRRATIQRHLLPVFISWLAAGADPDMGLLHFRTLSEHIGDSHWYLAFLRDSGVAASRLCSLLPNSRWVADALCVLPEAVQMLDDDTLLLPRTRQQLDTEIQAVLTRHENPEKAITRIRSVRNREVTRAALADALDTIEAHRSSIADACDALIAGALAVAEREEKQAKGVLHARVALVAMGRYGGAESSYASDADILAVHKSCSGATEEQATSCAVSLIQRVRSYLGQTGVGYPVNVDLDLRPEGRSGVMSRTVDSYREYYQRWACVWERQALLRARPLAGNPDLLQEFFEVINPIRYHMVPSQQDVRDIRLLKARMENERLPRGIEPSRHVKLGPGGLSDVEWMVQLAQMRYAHECPAVRLTSTIPALNALRDEGIIDPEHAQIMCEAWSLASRIRAGNVLATGRMSGVKLDVLPHGVKELVPLARLLGWGAGQEKMLEEQWLRASRRCRDVMDSVFWV
ncbi:bifunctional [glutamine synthetase] adenylyltransferase/[glutamine synthetase]-adenylyl-L-tyrosine phosphorylase [Schaalia sp. lx-260]|uniref:bifunctional [glutamine synthetase] adenylyltransferase/[glutamine synthetase]-adenylyl-L-tyrosine phosphorylase n=1 Tax=Schaalia sp. lx-260 TaxID=2899082 RepID=UPI001E41C8AE|nr:bifunctional [glutamine synthetase] adenylyltransferase/[glutamine synthetase]-adenylyl-L-tyrosine phosphorylase [Schaalia sp. lx-260]MCD4550206.1 bifunctional [glutamine synthetase] adenylyltransferase/[glutamine synthetase]-adenylyl-L-tyrosine phosphorylase [Schaalia sp. lx-260]